MCKTRIKRLTIMLMLCLITSMAMPTTTVEAKQSNTATIKKIKKTKPKLSMKAANGKELTIKVGKVKRATKYQIMIANNKKFTNKKIKTIKNNTYELKTKTNKNYYVKSRAVMKIGKKTYYSKWSNIKAKIITKKAYDEVIVDEEERYETIMVFNYDGYKPTSQEDAEAHIRMLMESGLPHGYHNEDILIPAVTHTVHHDAVYKIITIKN